MAKRVEILEFRRRFYRSILKIRVWEEENLENEPQNRSKSVLNKDESKAELSPMIFQIFGCDE